MALSWITFTLIECTDYIWLGLLLWLHVKKTTVQCEIVVNFGWLQPLYSLLYELCKDEQAITNFPWMNIISPTATQQKQYHQSTIVQVCVRTGVAGFYNGDILFRHLLPKRHHSDMVAKALHRFTRPCSTRPIFKDICTNRQIAVRLIDWLID